MAQATVDGLNGQGFNLYGFKAVESSNAAGAPVVWFKSSTFALQTAVDWTEQYQAFTTTQKIIPNGTITGVNAYDIDLGDTLQVTTTQGTGQPMAGGPAGAIGILNQTAKPFTCGISQEQRGTAMPMCAFPLNGNGLDLIVPIEQVLLMFATNEVDTGTVLEESYGPGVMIDLTADNSVTLSYDINLGWNWGGGTWARSIGASSALIPLLIQPSSGLGAQVLQQMAA
jgi:hypothetical protein